MVETGLLCCEAAHQPRARKFTRHMFHDWLRIISDLSQETLRAKNFIDVYSPQDGERVHIVYMF